jgi:hypothetical protein
MNSSLQNTSVLVDATAERLAARFDAAEQIAQARHNQLVGLLEERNSSLDLEERISRLETTQGDDSDYNMIKSSLSLEERLSRLESQQSKELGPGR